MVEKSDNNFLKTENNLQWFFDGIFGFPLVGKTQAKILPAQRKN